MLFIAFSIYIKIYIKDILENLIAYQTKGKAEVSIGKANIKVYPVTRLDLMDTRIRFLDSTGKNATYDVKFTYLGLQLRSLKAFALQKKLLVDFIVAENPRVEINPAYKEKKLKEGNKAVHFEIGTIFKAMQNIANSMQIKRFGILNGNIVLHNLAPNKTTISIGGVNFTAKELAMMPGKTSFLDLDSNTGRIRINTGKQDISLPEGNYRIRYSKLHLDTEEKLISIDSFKITGKALDTTNSIIEAGFAKFKLYNFDFNALYERDLIKIDSVICVDPVINLILNTSRKESKKPTFDLTIEKRVASLIGRLELGYLGLLNSNITITTRDRMANIPFNTKGNNFELFDIKIDSAAKIPVHVGKMIFAIKNYTARSKDGMYDVLFDSVVYNNQSLALKNFRIVPSAINKSAAKKFFSIPDFELVNLSISELISNKRLKADALLLKNAVMINNYLPRTIKSERPQPLRNLIKSISDKIDLEKIRIENGFIVHQSVLDHTQTATIGGLQSEISLNEMFDASTYELMGYSIGKVSFDSIVKHSGPVTISLYHGEARGRERKIVAEKILVTDSKSKARINANDVLIKNYHFDDDFTNITIDSIRYSSALVVGDQGRASPPSSGGSTPSNKNIIFRHILAHNTVLNYVSGDSVKAEAQLNKLELMGLVFGASQNITIDKLTIDGDGLSFSSPGLNARTGEFKIADASTSSINDLEFEMLKNRDTIRASISQIDLIPLINQTLKNKYPVIGEIKLKDPVIYASLNSKNPTATQAAPAKKEQALDLGLLTIENGKIDFRQRNGNKSLIARTNNVNLSVSEIRTNSGKEAIHVGKTSFSTGVFNVLLNDSISLMIDKGNLNLALDHFIKGKGADSGQVSIKLNRLEARQLNLSMITKKGKPFELKGFNLGGSDLIIDSLNKAHILQRIKNNPTLYVNNINLTKVDEKSELYAYGIGYLNGGKQVTVDSFRFHPAIDKDSFNRTLKFQKDYIQVHTKKIRIRDFDIEKIATDSSYTINYVEVDEPDLSIYKDKRIPFEHGIIKPLPVNMVGNIGPRIQIDSIRLYNGTVAYEEFNDKTNSIGKVFFTKMQVRLRNISNHDHGPTDSLKLGATARFLDTVNVSLRFNESYTDTLAAFLLQIRIGRFSLPAVNPVLRPLANAKIDNGYLDTLELKAIGREYLALGKMRMLYRDLKVELLNKEDQEKKTLLTKLESWAANLFVRTNNVKKTGTVFTQRVRERSVFNYWIKILLSGAMTNTGIKKNTKQEKKYKKSVKKINVPEIPEVDL
ncbi:MAG TPA: DUF748 domain-containing protein [Chitinophagaceae bacterium]|nr:DUF748 domain-containing protein [Chitinophagaceae bacterium]